MSIESETAEQMTKMMLEGTEVTIKATGKVAERLIIEIAAILKDTNKTAGKVNLTNLIKTGKELMVFTVKKENIDVFMKQAKRYGVLYTALINKKDIDIDGNIDILVKAEDAGKINRIVSRFDLNNVNSNEIKSNVGKNNPLVEGNQLENSLKPSKMLGVNRKSLREEVRKISEEMKGESSSIERKVVKKNKDIVK